MEALGIVKPLQVVIAAGAEKAAGNSMLRVPLVPDDLSILNRGDHPA
jgi:hypothetical protein